MNRLAIIAALASLGMGTAAQAGLTDTATADVTVTLEAPASVNIAKQADIAFGLIELPSSGGCGIRMNSGGEGFPGVLVHSSIASLPQCGVNGGTTSAGKMAVTCTAGTAISFVTTATNGSHAGATIANAGQTIQVGGDGGAIGAKGSDYTTVCPANGKMNVSFTTELYLDSSTAPGDNVTVGTVTLETTLG